MKREECVLGIDLGTSSVKLFLTGPLARQLQYDYGDAGIAETVMHAVRTLLESVPADSISAVGFSGQTGTFYTVEGEKITHSIAWHEAGREEALEEAIARLQPEDYIRFTGMRHPRLASYPVPTILYFQKKGWLHGRLMQPKEYLIYLLSGEFVSDCGSWRGLVNPASADFEPALLNELKIGREMLPNMALHTRVSAEGAARSGLREGTRIAVGLNDFYAGLYGNYIEDTGDCFDITGTSEHFGVVRDALGSERIIESPYLNGKYVSYGVTGSSGVSLKWCRRTFGEVPDAIVPKAPIFLPYLKGERQPVSDPLARGMFVGLADTSDRETLAYSVAEGVAFSIYSIYEKLGMPEIRQVSATGGATACGLLNRMKASLLNAPYIVRKPDCGSALGAVRAAGGQWEGEEVCFMPDAQMRDFLLERYALYRRMYTAWRDIVQDTKLF